MFCTVKPDQSYNPLPPASVYVSYSHREERLRERKAEGSNYKYSRKSWGSVNRALDRANTASILTTRPI
jgi:hypothetical protein